MSYDGCTIMKAATDKLSLALRAIADPTRRKILRLLHPSAPRKSRRPRRLDRFRRRAAHQTRPAHDLASYENSKERRLDRGAEGRDLGALPSHRKCDSRPPQRVDRGALIAVHNGAALRAALVPNPRSACWSSATLPEITGSSTAPETCCRRP